MENIDTINKLVQKKELWHNMSKFWDYVYWVTGIIGAIMSTLAAANDVAGGAVPVFSIIAALCFSIIGFANPQKQSVRYVGGYLLLEDALLAHGASLLSIEQVLKIYRSAEAIVHQDVAAIEPRTTPPVVLPSAVSPQ